MNWWWRMLKEAKSPKAIEHKRKYETEYESTPERKKYRRDLERERRKRGVAGKGGKDMSHTKRGTIVPEDPHTNRARSHPSVGSTLKTFLRHCDYCGVVTRPGQQCKCGNMVKAPQMVVIKAPQMNLSGHSAECELCKAPMSGQEAAMSNQMFGASVCTPCIMKEQQEINQQHDMMYHSEPMDIVARLLKDEDPNQKRLFVQGQKTLDGRPAFSPTDFSAQQQRRQVAVDEERRKQNRMLERMRHEALTNKERNAKFRQRQARAKQIREAQRRKNAKGLTPLPRFQQNEE
jgi:hypothetical protein